MDTMSHCIPQAKEPEAAAAEQELLEDQRQLSEKRHVCNGAIRRD